MAIPALTRTAHGRRQVRQGAGDSASRATVLRASKLFLASFGCLSEGSEAGQKQVLEAGLSCINPNPSGKHFMVGLSHCCGRS